MQIVTSNDWSKLAGMPEQNHIIALDWTLSEQEYLILRAGRISECMEDK